MRTLFSPMLFGLLALVMLNYTNANAQCPPSGQCQNQKVTSGYTYYVTMPAQATAAPDFRVGRYANDAIRPVATAQDVLNEVNAARASRGLRPFVLDENLSRGAHAAAVFRASNRMDGHTPNDFAFLPPGTTARAGGCGAWRDGMGWGTCCTYDDYQFAGAGFHIAPDGMRYMHLFVR